MYIIIYYLFLLPIICKFVNNILLQLQCIYDIIKLDAAHEMLENVQDVHIISYVLTDQLFLFNLRRFV